jgi:hypothetical protein
MTDQVKLPRKAISQFAAKRKPGYESALDAAAVASDEHSVTITRADYDRLRVEFALHCGPGCQLTKTFAWFGIKDNGTCGCAAYAAQMDAWGPDECFRRLEEIVEHLRGAAASQGLPFIATAARIAVARAIESARKELAHADTAPENDTGPDMVGPR